VKDHYVEILSPLAKKWTFDLQGFGVERRSSFSQESPGKISLTSTYDLEPSPVSDHEDARFNWLAGTIRGVFGKEVIVAPVLLTGMLIY
jgi:Gly-Xaa carboxypeptidase